MILNFIKPIRMQKSIFALLFPKQNIKSEVLYFNESCYTRHNIIVSDNKNRKLSVHILKQNNTQPKFSNSSPGRKRLSKIFCEQVLKQHSAEFKFSQEKRTECLILKVRFVKVASAKIISFEFFKISEK